MDALSPFQIINSITQTLQGWGNNPTPDSSDTEVLMELVKSVSKLRPYPEGIVTPKHLMTPSVHDRVLMRERLQCMSEQLRCTGVIRRVQTASASIVNQDQRDDIENLRRSTQILTEAIDRFSINHFRKDWPYWDAMSPEEINSHRATHLTWARGYLKESVINDESLLTASQGKERAVWEKKLLSVLNRWPELRTELSSEVPIIAEFLKSYDAPPSPGFRKIPPLKHLEEIAELSTRFGEKLMTLSDVIQFDKSIREFVITTTLTIPTLIEQVRIRELLKDIHGCLQFPDVKNAIENLPDNGWLKKLPEMVKEHIIMCQWHASFDLRYTPTLWAAVSLRELSSHWATYSVFLCEYLKAYGKEEVCLKILKEMDNVGRCLDERIEAWSTLTADQLAAAINESTWIRDRFLFRDPEPFESKGRVAGAPEPCRVVRRWVFDEELRKLESLDLSPFELMYRMQKLRQAAAFRHLLPSEVHLTPDEEVIVAWAWEGWNS